MKPKVTGLTGASAGARFSPQSEHHCLGRGPLAITPGLDGEKTAFGERPGAPRTQSLLRSEHRVPAAPAPSEAEVPSRVDSRALCGCVDQPPCTGGVTEKVLEPLGVSAAGSLGAEGALLGPQRALGGPLTWC